ncbi:MAG TPA: phospholipid carrier-dependent glycosyltransferase [Candidatus Acidoferrales bacterium]|nr:phospholipid carrier-dependent glycosyltransferase [Candidatus Acidoferrales bacterium]
MTLERISVSSLFLALLLLAVTLTGIWPAELYGPDEPREAEVAREMVRSGDYGVPHLLGRPFLEKPPLYQIGLALLYKANGANSRFVLTARLLSVLLGWTMVACVFLIARDAISKPAVLLAVLLMMQMPTFWKYSHTIVLDIALGAATTMFMACYYFLARDELPATNRIPLLLGAGLALGASFAIKSAVPFAIVVPVVLAHAWLFGRKGVIRELLSPWLVIPAVLPILVWAGLLYHEGGALYLHEHFVVNLLGRLLDRPFRVAGAELVKTDLGRRPNRYFYLSNLPRIFGLCSILAPFALLELLRTRRDLRDRSNNSMGLFAIWAVAPVALLSLAADKETSYLIPAMPGMALLCAALIDRALKAWRPDELNRWNIVPPAVVLAAALALVLVFGNLSRVAFLLGVWFLIVGTVVAIVLAGMGRLTETIAVACASIMACSIFMYSPSIQRRDQVNRTFTGFGRVVWSAVGAGTLYMYAPDETVAPSIAFEGDRDVGRTGARTVASALRGKNAYCLISKERWTALQANPELRDRFTVIFERQATPKEAYVLIRSRPLPDTVTNR